MVTKPSLRGRNAFSARLSPELSTEYKTRSMPLRKGDTVIVMRGLYSDIEGKVIRVDRKKGAIFVEGITREKSDGSTIFAPIHPSKVKITSLNLDDDRRRDIIERKSFKALI